METILLGGVLALLFILGMIWYLERTSKKSK